MTSTHTPTKTNNAFIADCARIQRTSTPTKWQAARLTFRNHGLQALLGYRLGRHLLSLQEQRRGYGTRLLGWPVYYLIRAYVSTALAMRLNLSADIGPGLYIGHFGNVLVDHCTMGAHCSIAQSTHLKTDENGVGPTVGNRVWIGAHAVIAGNLHIGDGSTVSAGALVKRDIPGGALCMGNPARVVMMDYDNSDIL